MEVLHRDGYERMPWKNGKGVTEEVMAFPRGSTVEDFDWRLSIAHVAGDGPFSVFPDIDRTIALLDGDPLALDISDPDNGSCRVKLACDAQPFSFPGEWKIDSRNLGGPTIDLNMMTRRGRCKHEMRRLILKPGQECRPQTVMFMVFNVPAQIETGSEYVNVSRFDTVILDQNDAVTVRCDVPAEVLAIWVRVET